MSFQLKKNLFTNLNRIISKFIWQGKKPRIKLKLLQDAKERGGFGLPDWEKYCQAATLVWVSDWLHLKNRRLLTLEGHELQTGWHAILWEEKYKVHEYFQRHYIRRALLDTWIKTKKSNYIEVPNWISIVEMFAHPKLIRIGGVVTYKELLNEKGELKSRNNLKEEGIELEW